MLDTCKSNLVFSVRKRRSGVSPKFDVLLSLSFCGTHLIFAESKNLRLCIPTLHCGYDQIPVLVHFFYPKKKYSDLLFSMLLSSSWSQESCRRCAFFIRQRPSDKRWTRHSTWCSSFKPSKKVVEISYISLHPACNRVSMIFFILLASIWLLTCPPHPKEWACSTMCAPSSY